MARRESTHCSSATTRIETYGFAGKVRAGFVPHVRRELLSRLKPLQVKVCPFANLPDATTGRWGGGVTAEQMDEMAWLRPDLVAQIRFVEWTSEGWSRHAKFIGLRNDKAAREVRREGLGETANR